jgi:hypothetical protein
MASPYAVIREAFSLFFGKSGVQLGERMTFEERILTTDF